MMTNQEFCYWLQGYFEISVTPSLTKRKILAIASMLTQIEKPLGAYTQWLYNLTQYFADIDYRQSMLNYFLPVIQANLNQVFLHVIDNSYDTAMTHQERLNIHNGSQHE